MATVLVPLPSRDFDPTEAAVSWKVLGRLGHDVAFATPDGREAVADDVMVTGEGLDLWGLVPVLKRIKVIGAVLRADSEGRSAYAQMLDDSAYRAPQNRRHQPRPLRRPETGLRGARRQLRVGALAG